MCVSRASVAIGVAGMTEPPPRSTRARRRTPRQKRKRARSGCGPSGAGADAWRNGQVERRARYPQQPIQQGGGMLAAMLESMQNPCLDPWYFFYINVVSRWQKLAAIPKGVAASPSTAAGAAIAFCVPHPAIPGDGRSPTFALPPRSGDWPQSSFPLTLRLQHPRTGHP